MKAVEFPSLRNSMKFYHLTRMATWWQNYWLYLSIPFSAQNLCPSVYAQWHQSHGINSALLCHDIRYMLEQQQFGTSEDMSQYSLTTKVTENSYLSIKSTLLMCISLLSAPAEVWADAVYSADKEGMHFNTRWGNHWLTVLAKRLKIQKECLHVALNLKAFSFFPTEEQ